MDDPSWTLDRLHYGNHEEDSVANRAATLRLVDEYGALWLSSQSPTASQLFAWLRERFDVNVLQPNWDTFVHGVTKEKYRISTLVRFLQHHNAYDGDAKRTLVDSARVLFNVQDLVMHLGRLFRNRDPLTLETRNYLPDALRDDDAYVANTANVIAPHEEKNSNFQSAFLHMVQILEGLHYRRAFGKFFKRVTTAHGVEALAFEEVMTIATFVGMHSMHSVNYRVWKWVTDPPSNFDRLIEALTKRPIPEARDLVENLHLRSYAGDAYGRGAGVYDSFHDMFWPYAQMEHWPEMARHVTTVRRRFDPSVAVCKPPDPSDVSVVHLEAPFVFDVYNELLSLPNPGLSWREADEFECRKKKHRLDAPTLAEIVARRLAVDAPLCAPAVGHSWQRVTAAPDGWTTLPRGPVHDLLEAAQSDVPSVPADVVDPLALHEKTVVVVTIDGDDEIFIPNVTPPRRPRATVTEDELDDADILSNLTVSSFLEHNGRFFRLDTGRTWHECNAPDIDQIYKCQQFGVHDCFLLYALKGRLLFPVHELDSQSLTLFFEGIAGCGKSTCVKAICYFYPSHLRGNLSSNMQPQFGMSAVAEKAIILCNEVSENLQIVQEEWQASTGGEWGSFARKFQDPLECIIRAQHFWVGNAFPVRFNNKQGQVSRRLAGVLMAHPVSPRDGMVLARIKANLASLQRKMILAYFEFVRQTAHVDIMSQVDQLPPAFADYHRKSRRATDPVLGFLTDGKFVELAEGEVMLMSDFKELYNKFRVHYDMGKPVKWGEACYRTPFNEFGLRVESPDTITIQGKTYSKEDVVYGLRPVAGMLDAAF